MTTFCWLPPDERADRVLVRAEHDPEPVDVAAQALRGARGRSGRSGVSRPSVGSAKFPRIDIQLKSESSRRSRGT